MAEKSHSDESISWEADMLTLLFKSERRAWLIAKVAVIIAVVAIVGAVAIMFMKRSQVFLLRENADTGVVDLLTSITEVEIPYDEVRDKYWLSQFVRARERYDWQNLQADYDMIGIMSSEQVWNEYDQLFKGDKALDKKFGDHIKASIDILSRTVEGNGRGTIRFEKSIKDSRNPDGEPQKSRWVASITYKYVPANWEKESTRMINPFGFIVTSYRVDPEGG